MDDIENMVGPVIGNLPCTIAFEELDTVLEVLQRRQKDYIEGLAHQTVSLAGLHHRLGIGSRGLFNTLFSYQKVQQPGHGQVISLEEIGGRDPTEV